MTNKQPLAHPDPIINKICEALDRTSPKIEGLLAELAKSKDNSFLEREAKKLVENIPVYIQEIVTPKYPDLAIQEYIKKRLFIWSMSFWAKSKTENPEEKEQIVKDWKKAEQELEKIQPDIIDEFDKFSARRSVYVSENIKKIKGNVVDILEYKQEKDSQDFLESILGNPPKN